MASSALPTTLRTARREITWRNCAPSMTVFAVGAISLGCVDSIAQTPTPSDPPVTAWVMGTMVYRGNHKGQRYFLHASVSAPARQ